MTVVESFLPIYEKTADPMTNDYLLRVMPSSSAIFAFNQSHNNEGDSRLGSSGRDQSLFGFALASKPAEEGTATVKIFSSVPPKHTFRSRSNVQAVVNSLLPHIFNAP